MKMFSQTIFVKIFFLGFCFSFAATFSFGQEKIPLDTPPFGSPEKAAELEKLIHETVFPEKTAPKEVSKEIKPLLEWSQPSGGLVGRIEYVSEKGASGLVVLVRLKTSPTVRSKSRWAIRATPNSPGSSNSMSKKKEKRGSSNRGSRKKCRRSLNRKMFTPVGRA
jgi:hypothetical protein